MDEQVLEQARVEALAADRCFSKGRLREEFRMKPKPGAVAVSRYRNGFGGWFEVFRIADCVPLRERVKGEQTAREAKARAVLAVRAKLRSSLAKASRKAAAWMADEVLVIDTETTGLGDDAQVIELAIVDASGAVLLETRLRPSVPVEPGAAEVHGIGEAELASAPVWPEVAAKVEALLRGRCVVAFNAEFDFRLLRQTGAAFGDGMPWLNGVERRCAMYLAAAAYGATNRHGTISLWSASLEAGVSWEGAAHSAVADAWVTAALLRSLAQVSIDLDAELAALQGVAAC
jgi:DNA polymerase III epsilon subunit-like protein